VAAATSPRGMPLWRVQSDVVNTMLIQRWLPAAGLRRVLKTDLFDEFVGTGLYPSLRGRTSQVVGVDISPAIASSAGTRYPDLEAVVADIRALPFPDDFFDGIVSNSTLDHFAGPNEVETAIGELQRVLRPGGRLVLTLDNPLNPIVALRNVLPAGVARAARGVSYEVGWTCGPRRLARLLSESGFSIRDITAVLHFPRVMVASLGAAPDGPVSSWRSLFRAAERLERLPTRYLTGHFIAALAEAY
jgi:SAM-dependent methyltransferase